jgi:hypothetical protein
VALWYPVEDDSTGPWFEVRGSMVYTADSHPQGRSSNPWLQVRGGLAYPVLDHPMAGAARPWYEVDAYRVVPAAANPDPMQFTVVIVENVPAVESGGGPD